ncbi:MAG: hypothetical protein ACXABY_00670 [Candidatus Thorarchaeota archaeon]
MNQNDVPSITADLEWIPPEKARQYLGTSKGNRGIKKPRVDNLGGIMESGEFVCNGSPIHFGIEGGKDVLYGGHHRLKAGSDFDIGFWSLVVRGVPEAARLTLDPPGTVWSTGDHLKYLGFLNANTLGKAARDWWTYHNLDRAVHINSSNQPSPSKIVETVYACPGLQESVKFVQQGKDLVSQGMLAWLHYDLSIHNNVQTVNDLFMRFMTGVDLSSRSPLRALRNRLQDERLRKAKKKQRLHVRVVAAYCITGFNAALEGRKLSKIMVKDLSKLPRLYGM